MRIVLEGVKNYVCLDQIVITLRMKVFQRQLNCAFLYSRGNIQTFKAHCILTRSYPKIQYLGRKLQYLGALCALRLNQNQNYDYYGRIRFFKKI